MNATLISITTLLERLVETCRDGQQGFLSAAQDVKNPAFKTLFRETAMERREFAGELQALLNSLGSEKHPVSTVTGAFHRGWMDIKAALADGDEHAVLTECERGEDAAFEAYREALVSEDLPIRVREVLDRQFERVKASHDRIRRLRDTMAEK